MPIKTTVELFGAAKKDCNQLFLETTIAAALTGDDGSDDLLVSEQLALNKKLNILIQSAVGAGINLLGEFPDCKVTSCACATCDQALAKLHTNNISPCHEHDSVVVVMEVIGDKL